VEETRTRPSHRVVPQARLRGLAGHHNGTRPPLGDLVCSALGIGGRSVGRVLNPGWLVHLPPSPHCLGLIDGLRGADGALGALLAELPGGAVVAAAITLHDALLRQTPVNLLVSTETPRQVQTKLNHHLTATQLASKRKAKVVFDSEALDDT
jgi:hypothetical protein